MGGCSCSGGTVGQSTPAPDSIGGVPVDVTERALEVLGRALDAGRLDRSRVGIRVALARGLRGEEVRIGFAEEPEPGEVVRDAGGIRLFVPKELDDRNAVIDVAEEHDRIILR